MFHISRGPTSFVYWAVSHCLEAEEGRTPGGLRYRRTGVGEFRSFAPLRTPASPPKISATHPTPAPTIRHEVLFYHARKSQLNLPHGTKY